MSIAFGRTRSIVPSQRFRALPNVNVPIEAFMKADCYPISEAIKVLSPTKDIAQYASGVITLLETVHPTNRIKVHLYILNRGLYLAEKLESAAQKIELLVRMTSLLEPEERYKSRDEIEARFEIPLQSSLCSASALVQLANLHAQTKDVEGAAAWLKKGNGTWKEWRAAAKILFEAEAFEEGKLLIRRSGQSVPVQSLEKTDPIDLLLLGLEHPSLVDDKVYLNRLQSFHLELALSMVIIKAFCHINKIEPAKELALKTANFHRSVAPFIPVLKMARASEEQSQHCLRGIYQYISTSDNPLRLFFYLCSNPELTYSEAMYFLSRSDLLAKEKVSILWDRLKAASDPDEKLEMLGELRRSLTEESTDNDLSRFWIEILKTYFVMECFDEMIQTTLLWKKQQVLPGVEADRFFCFSGIMKLALGIIDEGLEELKLAHQICVEEDSKKQYSHFNTFGFFTGEAVVLVNDLAATDRIKLHAGFELWKNVFSGALTYEVIEKAFL